VYYSEWSYQLDKFPSDIPLSHVTHIYFAFMKIGSNSIQWNDDHLDRLQSLPLRISPTTALDDNIQSLGLSGQLAQMKYLKKGLKVLMSVGGANTNSVFESITKSKKSVDKFVLTSVNWMSFYDFDGIDLDWEFPDSKYTSKLNYLVKSLKNRMAQLEKESGYSKDTFQLTMAIPLDIETLKNYDFTILSEYVSYFNVMGYDMSGPWSELTGYHSNLFATEPQGLSIDRSIKYLSEIIKPNKLVLGMPNYGRTFNNNKLNVPFSECGDVPGVDQDDDECIVRYDQLPPENFTVVYDSSVVGAYAYNEELDSLVSYDTPECAVEKAKYVKTMGLGGGMWWDSAGDPFYSDANSSLLFNFVQELGGIESL
ncbi:glycoside hydrolase family 18 protein, partial [[Candida] arabinofermentans NRRL YB-2248]